MAVVPATRVIERISARERELVDEVLATDFRSTTGGLMINRLEQAFAEAVDARFAISFVNGTATMHAGLLAAGVGPGDEVIVPPLTMSSTTFVVLQAGAVPIFADVDPDTFQVDPQSVRERCTEHTKAIIPVALYGLSPELDELNAIAAEHGLVVIEDDAETMDSTYRGRPLGAIGDMGSFSFQSSKHLTAGEGGMLTTNDEELALAVRRINSLGYAGVGASKAKITRDDIQDPSYSRHVSFGFNYRIPELCAAVVLGQLERRAELVGRRREVAALFGEVAAGCEWLHPQTTPAHCDNSYWTWVARLDHPSASWHDFRRVFLGHGGDKFYGAWKLSYLEPMFASGSPVQDPRYRGDYQPYGPGLCPAAEEIQPRLMQFPTNYWDWSEAERQASALQATIDELS
jgi:perosamine synthetase